MVWRRQSEFVVVSRDQFVWYGGDHVMRRISDIVVLRGSVKEINKREWRMGVPTRYTNLYALGGVLAAEACTELAEVTAA